MKSRWIAILAFIGFSSAGIFGQDVRETFQDDPVASGRFIQQTAGTESSFRYSAPDRRLNSVLDVDRSPAFYLSKPFAPVTDLDDISYSTVFRVGEIDASQTPTAFIGLSTITHVEMGGDGLTINLGMSAGRLVAVADIDDDGTSTQDKAKFGGREIPLEQNVDYYAIGIFSASARTFTIRLYDGPQFTRFVGESIAPFPDDRRLLMDRIGLQNGGGRTTDQTVGSMAVSVSQLSIPGHIPIFASCSDAAALEGNPPASSEVIFKVRLSTANDHPITVNFRTADLLAKAGVDYMGQTNSILFSPGEIVREVHIPILPNRLGDGDRTFLLMLSSGGDATILGDTATGTILDDDFPKILFNDLAIVEGDQGLQEIKLPVTLSNPSKAPVQVSWTTVDETATAPADYIAASGIVRFEPGTTNAFVILNLVGDELRETDETFVVHFLDPINAQLPASASRVTIKDNDNDPTVRVLVDSEFNEGDSGGRFINFQITLSHPTQKRVSVSYRTEDGTALAGEDYQGRSGSVSFSPGVVQQTVGVFVYGDRTFEPTETFVFHLLGSTSALLETDTIECRILNDDPPPVITISDAALLEGNSGTQQALFDVFLDRPAAMPVRIHFATTDGTARAGEDYLAASGDLEFAPGVTNRTIAVTVIGDVINEADETFSILLTNPQNATLGDSSGLGTILNDDGATIRVANASTREGNPDSDTNLLVFRVTLSRSAEETIFVTYTTLSETAEVDRDFSFATGRLAFLPGVTNLNVSVRVRGDAIDEPNETMILRLSDPVNATIGNTNAIGTILDDDPPFVSISDAQVVESDIVTTNMIFKVSLSSPFESVVTVEYATDDGTAEAGSDYIATAGVVLFEPGETNKFISIPIVGDLFDEEDEDFYVDLFNPSNALLKNSESEGRGVIVDNDPEPELLFGDFDISECDQGTTTAKLKVSLSNPSGKPITLDYHSVDDTAVAGKDFLGLNGQLTIAPGDDSATISITINCDLLGGGDSGFWLEFGGFNVSIPGNKRARIRIHDNDPPGIFVADARVTEGDSGSRDADFKVSLSYSPTNTVRFEYFTRDETAVAGLDYEGRSGLIVFPPGVTSTNIIVRIFGDTEPEVNETFQLQLTNAVAATLLNGMALGTILDDDFPRVAISGGSVREGDEGTTNLNFNVTLDRAGAQALSVSYFTTEIVATDGRAATEGRDYVRQTSTLTFLPGETNKVIPVAILGDLFTELDETFAVDLSNPINGILAISRAIGVILNDDGVPRVTVNSASVSERSANFSFRVDLSASSSLPVTLLYDTVDETGVAGVDYIGRTNQLISFIGTTTRTVTIPIIQNEINQSSRTFRVRLHSPTNAVIEVAEAQMTIIDDDQADVSIQDVAVIEGNSGSTVANFQVTMSRASDREVIIPYATADPVSSAATAGEDYVAATGELHFLPGITNQSIQITVIADTRVESDERFLVRLLGTAAEGVRIVRSQAVGTIIDDDDLLVSVSGATVIEGNVGVTNLVFPITLSGIAAEAVSVNYTVNPITATAGVDFLATSGTLTIPAGMTNATIVVPVIGDLNDEPDETLSVTLSNPVNARRVGPPAIGTILDDDPPELLIHDVVVNAATGAVTAEFRFTLSSAGSVPTSVTYFTANGSAVAGADFEARSGILVFPAGVLETNLLVQIKGNTTDETNEQFSVTLSGPQNARLLRLAGVCTILNGLPNESPTISALTNLVLNEDSPSSAIPFRVADLETLPESLIVSAASSNVVLFPDGNLRISGAGTNRSITLIPAPDASGQALITLSVTDEGGLSARSQFVAVVQPVNDPPGFQKGSDIEVAEDSGPFSLAGWAAQISPGPADEFAQSILFEVSNDNTFLFEIPPALSPTGTLTFKPAPNAFGVATIAIVAQDNGGIERGGINRSTPKTARISITPVNDPPTLNPISDLVIKEDSAAIDVSISGISSGPNEHDTLSISAKSSAPDLLPNPIVTYNSGQSTGLLTIKPAPGQSGIAQVTVTVDDGGAGVHQFSRTFQVTVQRVNRLPVLTGVRDKALLEDASGELAFTISDRETAPDRLRIEVNSTNPNLLPNSSLQLSGSGGSRVLRFTPLPDQFGAALVTISVTDEDSATEQASLNVVVIAVNDPPTLTALPDITIVEGAQQQSVLLAGISPGPANENQQRLTFTSISDNPTLIPNPTVIYSGGANTGELRFQSADGQSGSALITVTAVDDGGVADGGVDRIVRQFHVTVLRGHLPPVLAVVPTQTVIELEQLVVTNRATSRDFTQDQLQYRLLEAPAGAEILAGGIIRWTPSEAQGPATNVRVRTEVSDTGNPPFRATNEFLVNVLESNTAPKLMLPPGTTSRVGELIRFVASATDADLPRNELTFSLPPGAPAGASIDPVTGNFQWIPQAAGTYSIRVRVSDDNPSAINSRLLLDEGTISLVVTNAPNVFSIAINQPSNGSFFSYQDAIAIKASVNLSGVAIADVQFYVGTSQIDEMSTGPFQTTWVPSDPGGTVTLSAVAYDSLGRRVVSDPVQISIRDIPGDIAIVRKHASAETDLLVRMFEEVYPQIYVGYRGLDVREFDLDQVDLSQLLGFRLIIFDDLGAADPVTVKTMDLLIRAHNLAIPIYLIGEHLTLLDQNATSRDRQRWADLTHLRATSTVLTNAVVHLEPPYDRDAEIFPVGTNIQMNFVYPGVAAAAELADNLGEVRAKISGKPALVRFPMYGVPEGGLVRTLSQTFLVSNASTTDVQSANGIANIFIRACTWLMGSLGDNFNNAFSCPNEPIDSSVGGLTLRFDDINNGRDKQTGVVVVSDFPEGFMLEKAWSSWIEKPNSATFHLEGNRLISTFGIVQDDSVALLYLQLNAPVGGLYRVNHTFFVNGRRPRTCQSYLQVMKIDSELTKEGEIELFGSGPNGWPAVALRSPLLDSTETGSPLGWEIFPGARTNTLQSLRVPLGIRARPTKQEYYQLFHVTQ